MIGASTNQGFINIFPNNKNQVANNSPQEELYSLKHNESPIHNFKFSLLQDSILAAAQDDGVVAVYDLNSKQSVPQTQFQSHRASARGVAFSALNKLLLASVSIDKSINFYDIAKGKKVSGLVAPEALQCISFNSDGHTVAVGSMLSGNVYAYDLRN